MDYNPASVTSLTQLMEAGLYIQHPGWAKTTPGQGGALLFCRLRYFDPERRRAGVPPDVAALIDSMTADSVSVNLVNLNPTDARTVTIQGGAYGEHQITSVSDGAHTWPVNDRAFTVHLAPSAGARLTVTTRRFANVPTIKHPSNA